MMSKSMFEKIWEAHEFGIPLYSLGSQRQGIVHVIGPELGVTQPGLTIVCGDSHTSTHGAFGALAFGIGTSEVEHVLATQCLPQRKPKSMRLLFTGELVPGVTAKDVILAAIGRVFIGSCTNARIEDLRVAAAVVDGRRVHPNVRAMVVPGSAAVKRRAEEEGLDR